MWPPRRQRKQRPSSSGGTLQGEDGPAGDPTLGERSGERLLWTRKKPSPSGTPSSRGG